MLLLGYVLGSAMFLVGVLVLLGFFQFQGSMEEAGNTLRVIFGIVLMLYGIYRISITETQRRRAGRQ